MEVLLLGTGGPEGWPVPGCGCASCEAVRGTPDGRGHATAVVGGVLRLDGGATAPVPAGVRAAVATHRCAGGADAPLPRPGEELDLARHLVRVLPAGASAVALDVTGPDGARLLWAPLLDPLSISDVHSGQSYDVACVGAAGPHGLPLAVAALRRAGAVGERTSVLAVHIGHEQPPPPELRGRLAAWDVTLPSDGDRLTMPGDPPPRAASPGRTLALGGARSGKSEWAERQLLAEPAVTYVATAPRYPDDPEWTARLTAHLDRRPPHWRTLETTDVAALLREPPAAPLLVDDLGLWLTAVLDRGEDAAAWAVDELVAAWRATPARVVAVSPETGLGVVPATPAGRTFRDALGRLNVRLAAESDRVVLVTAGLPTVLR